MTYKMRTQNLIVGEPSRQAGSESSRFPPARERDPYLTSLEFIDKKVVTLNDFWLYEVYRVCFQVNISAYFC